MSSSAGDTAGEIFANVIDYELEQERARRTSLEQRAMAVVTSSGVLVSLVFGFGALLKGQGAAPRLPGSSRVLLALALLAFVAAAVMSLLTNRPRDYKPFGVKASLERMVEEDWFIPADDARRLIAEFRTGEVDRWRDNNKAKAAYLQWAITLECVGIALLAVAMTVILV